MFGIQQHEKNDDDDEKKKRPFTIKLLGFYTKTLILYTIYYIIIYYAALVCI